MASKGSSSEKQCPEAFITAMDSYYSTIEELTKLAPNAWRKLPEEPMNELPLQPNEMPWWDKELESQYKDIFDTSGLELASDLKNLDMNQDGVDHKEESAETATSQSGKKAKQKSKQQKAAAPEKKWRIADDMDDDLFVAKVLGLEGMLVPAGLKLS